MNLKERLSKSLCAGMNAPGNLWRITVVLLKTRSVLRQRCPILLTIEDACPHADLVDDGPLSIDCGSCSYFRQPAESVLGVCHNDKMRSGSIKQGDTGASKEETL